ncbi:CAP domain-containing protein [Cupriavidus sp. TMH.W2]|uniref:CAP domain-containing protein n=1 Tax=Cupriavidus sp. TMH.W2 TaxID=3434465 RepID=UPI003D773D00
MNKNLLVVAAISTLLAACGGGGGDSNSPSTPAGTAPGATTPPPAPAPTSVQPATSAPAPTYPSSDARLAAFSDLNTYRIAMGVGALRQDTNLDLAADNHLGYMKANGSIGHMETAGNPGFTGANPYDQAVAAGASKAQWVGQASDGSLLCLANFKNTVYHLQGITSNQETVGLAIRDSYCVINFGLVAGANGSGYGLPQWGGQQMPTSSFAYSPIDNENVTGAFTPGSEQPNPAPDLTMAGHPIMFRVNVANASDVLTVSNFTLTGPGGAAIPARILVPSNAKSGSVASAVEDANLYRGVVFLLPTQRMAAGAYTATFVGARNGVAITKSWSFTAF